MSRAFSSLPSVHSYAQALRIATQTKPIRGRSSEIIPLGRRSDADQFNIQVHANKDVVLRIHNTPAITYHPDETITLHPYSYGGNYAGRIEPQWTSCITRFIHEVLHPFVLSVGIRNKMLFLDTSHTAGSRLVVPPQPTRFTLDQAMKAIDPITPLRLTSLRINRTAANNVRKRFGKFYRYMKGMIGVRKQLHVETNAEYITFHIDEAVAVIPDLLVPRDSSANANHPLSAHRNPNFAYINRELPCLSAKPPKLVTNRFPHRYDPKPYEGWRAAADEYVRLITPTEDEEQTALNFSRAFSLLLAQRIQNSHLSIKGEHSMDVRDVQATADEILFKIFSEEVFEHVETKPGQIPSKKYDTWVTREEGRI